MTRAADRLRLMTMLEEAVDDGIRQSEACQCVGISERTFQRWRRSPDDRHPTTAGAVAKNKLSAEEVQQVLAICHEPRFASLSPAQIVPALADEGRYIASESTFYRVPSAGTAKQTAVDLASDGPQPGVVMGYHLVEIADSGPLVLPVPDRRRIQP